MRILHVDTGAEMRGGQWQVIYLLEGLRERGVENMLLARKGSPLQQEARRHRFPVEPAGLFAIHQLSAGAALVHAHTGRAHTLAAVAARAPVVVSRRVAFPLQRGPLSAWKYRRAARYIAISNAARLRLLEAGVADSQIMIVHDGVPELPLGSRDGAIVAPYSGDPRKGNALVREAARIAGVSVLFSRDLLADLSTAQALVYITDEEGLGSAALLAMSAGVPVVASRVGGLCEVIEHNSSGVLTENTPERIASAIRRLVDEPVLAGRLGQAAAARARREFTVERMVAGTLAVYHEVAP